MPPSDLIGFKCTLVFKNLEIMKGSKSSQKVYPALVLLILFAYLSNEARSQAAEDERSADTSLGLSEKLSDDGKVTDEEVQTSSEGVDPTEGGAQTFDTSGQESITQEFPKQSPSVTGSDPYGAPISSVSTNVSSLPSQTNSNTPDANTRSAKQLEGMNPGAAGNDMLAKLTEFRSRHRRTIDGRLCAAAFVHDGQTFTDCTNVRSPEGTAGKRTCPPNSNSMNQNRRNRKRVVLCRGTAAGKGTKGLELL